MLSPTNEKTSYEQLLPSTSTSTSTLRSGERERENGMVKSVADQQFINSSNGFARSPGPTLKEYLVFFFVSLTSRYDELKI